MRRRQPRHQARLAGLQDVEGHEEEEQHHAQFRHAGRARAQQHQRQLHQQQQHDGAAPHGQQVAAPLGREQPAHQHERGRHRRQVDVPVHGLGQAGGHQQPRHHHPHGHLHRVQHEHAQVQPPQARVPPDVGQAAARLVGVLHGLGRRPQQHDGDAAQRQRRRQPEQAGQPEPARQRRRRHERDGKHQPDAHAHQRHALGAHLVAGQVGQQRGDGGRHGARALQRAADHQPVDAAGQRRQHAAGGEHQQARHDDALAAQPVGRQAQRHLHHRLREAVEAHGQADQRRVVAAGVLACLQREHRQHQEQAQHAQREDRRQRLGGTPLVRRHAVGGGGSLGGKRCSGHRIGQGSRA